MKLKPKYNDPNNMIDYKLDTHDGQFSQSKMPATIAEEIAQRASSVTLGEEKGFELVVNGDTLLPKDIFDFEEGEVEGLKPTKKRRTAKIEPSKEAGEGISNAE